MLALRPVLAMAFLSAALVAQEAGALIQAPPRKSTWRETIDKGRDQLADRLFGIKLSAFGDVIAAPDDQGKQQVDLGSFELDLAADLFENLDAAAAVVTNQDATKLTAAFLDFHPFGGTIAPRGRLWVEKGFHIQVGRFDVPFGNDWQFFASKDSVSISRPLTTDGIMDGGYNDVGMRALGNNGTVNFNTFLLRGFGDGRLIGARIGLTPFGNPFSLKEARNPKSAEIGFSYLYDTGSERRKQEVAWAVDTEGRLGNWYLHGEYMERRQEPEANTERITRRGWHLAQEYAWSDLPAPTTLFIRYERIGQRPLDWLIGDDHEVRAVAGASILLAGIFQLKAEWQHLLEATAATREAPGYSRDAWLAQLVVVF
jgi:hypothetical protein